MKKRSRVKTRIKGIFILLVILSALGAVFYFGYYQFQLPVDTYGVIFTRLEKWDPVVVQAGTNRFEWEGLLPTNLIMEEFSISPRRIELSITGELPSAKAYSSYLEGSPDFSYNYRILLTYSLKPDFLPSLVSEEFLRAETIESWYEEFESTLVIDGISFINKKSTDDSYMSKISYNFRLMEKDLLEEFSTQYEAVEFINFVPIKVEIPDLDLYREGKRQYFSMARFNEKINMAALEKTANRLVEESAKLEILNKYGEIFSRYPELISYYGIYRKDGEGLIPAIELPNITK
ncbi:MAG: hypothetical protein JEZ04_02095 [Spirochaetales bacterium]|nr:hypothetical protein [Spirochaetales bacterium]